MLFSEFSRADIIHILTEEEYKKNCLKISDMLPLYSASMAHYLKEYHGAESVIFYGVGYSEISAIVFCLLDSDYIKTTDIELVMPLFLDDSNLSNRHELVREYLNIFSSVNDINFASGIIKDLNYVKLIDVKTLGFQVSIRAAMISSIEDTYDFQKRHFRKSYKSLINKAYRSITIDTIDSKSSNLDFIFKEMEDFHMLVSKRKTRSALTWELQKKIVQQSEAFVVRAFFDNEFVGFNIVLYNSNWAYYGVGVYSRLHLDLSLGHVIQAETFRRLIELGLSSYYLGDFDGKKGDKEYNISMFKKGFANSESLRLCLSR